MALNRDMRILIVDDFPAMRRLLRNALRELEMHNVVQAADGIQASRVLESDDIDFVICDWNMPNMTGIQLLEWVRNHQTLSHTPFMMVTAEGLKENVVEAVKKGVSNYIVKPFTAETLETKIRQIFH